MLTPSIHQQQAQNQFDTQPQHLLAVPPSFQEALNLLGLFLLSSRNPIYPPHLAGVPARTFIPSSTGLRVFGQHKSFAELENFSFASHVITVRVTPTSVTLTYVRGALPLTVVYQSGAGTEETQPVQPGEKIIFGE